MNINLYFHFFSFFFFGRSKYSSYNSSSQVDEETDLSTSHLFSSHQRSLVSDRDNEYTKRRFARAATSPTRADAFSSQDSSSRSYAQIMKETRLQNEEALILRQIEKKRKGNKNNKTLKQFHGIKSNDNLFISCWLNYYFLFVCL
jgi:hypothetical protein